MVELMYKEDIELFLEKVNGHHPSIKFTTEVSEIETTFLDTTVYNGALKGFFLGSNLRFGGRQSTVTMVFTRWPREDTFPVSRALGGKCRRLSRVSNIILLQDLTPLHLKYTRSTNLWSVCLRKLKLSTHLNTLFK